MIKIKGNNIWGPVSMKDLTEKDKRMAERYLILRSARKALKSDRKLFLQTKGFYLSLVFKEMIDCSLEYIEKELKAFDYVWIRVSRTEQGVIYDVRIDDRQGYIGIDGPEVQQKIKELFLKGEI